MKSIIAVLEEETDTNIGEYLGTLMMSVVEIWKAHLSTGKYAEHMALDEYYKEAPEKIDTIIEEYIGIFGKPSNYTNTLELTNDPVAYLEDLHDFVHAGRKFGQHPELESAIDDLLGLINSVLYKLKELK